jgi:uncharacterized membrane protein YwaF
MLDWLKSHVFLAAWSSPIIALIALIRRKSDPTNRINWGEVVLYVGFLSALAAVITPDIESTARSVMETVLFMSLGAILYRTGGQ